jgi:Glycosyl transferase family 2
MRSVVQGSGNMRLAAVTMVRSECDIIEAFVRHNAAFFDRLYILDHRSTDTTPEILRKLADEGLPLVLSREDYGIFYQAPNMTHLIKRAFDDFPWDFIVPLDSDEFLRIRDRAALEAALADLDGDSIGLSDIINYVPTEIDDFSEIDALRRIVHRAKTIPDASCKIGKVIIPGAVVRQPGFSLNEGHHGVCIDGEQVPERRLEGLSLAHFPVRSINQFILRCAGSHGLRDRTTIQAGAGITERFSSSCRSSLRSRPPTSPQRRYCTPISTLSRDKCRIRKCWCAIR